MGEANFSLKIVLSSTESVYLFLFNLIVENFNRIENNEVKLLSKNVFLDSKNNIQHIISVPAKTFFDVDDFFSKSIKDIDLKNFNLSINLALRSISACKDKNKLIKNISFFWINK